MLYSDFKHPNPEVQGKVEEVFKQFFSVMMDKRGGYDGLRKEYLGALKEIHLNRPGALWLSFWHGGDSILEGYTAVGDGSIQSRVRSFVEVMTACTAIPFECGQVAYIVPSEDPGPQSGFVWSLAPTVSCAEGWTITPVEGEEDKVELEHLPKDIYDDTAQVDDVQTFGGFATVFCSNIFKKDDDFSEGIDPDFKIFAQYLKEKGHDLKFDLDKILCR